MPRRLRWAIFSLALASLSSPVSSWAQDAHYWGLHYGPSGQLLGGTMVGGVQDLSSTYYSPGALALIEDPRFLISFSTFQITHVTVKNAAGEGLDFSDTRIRSIPRIVAGHIDLGEGKDRFSYSIITRQDDELRFQTSGSAIDPSSPDGRAALARLDQRLVEYWAGGTWARTIGEGLGVGVSTYIALRNQNTRSEFLTEDVAGSSSRAALITDDYSFTHFRLLWKLGAAWRRGPLQLAANVTTAGIPIYGWGSATFNAATVGDVAEPFIAASTQKDLATEYKSPWSVSGGATYRWGRTALHAAGEWYGGVSRFEILSPDPAPVTGSDQTVPLAFPREVDSVFNYGVGVEHRFSGRDLALYASFFRDHSSRGPDSLDTLSDWDLTHVRAGVTVGTEGIQWGIGGGYAWGREDVPRLSPPDATVTEGTARASVNRFSIFLALAFGSTNPQP
jgi:hypothetical protein